MHFLGTDWDPMGWMKLTMKKPSKFRKIMFCLFAIIEEANPSKMILITLPETNSLPLEIGAPWKRRFRTWKPSFSGAMLVSGRVYNMDTKKDGPWKMYLTANTNRVVLGISSPNFWGCTFKIGVSRMIIFHMMSFANLHL